MRTVVRTTQVHLHPVLVASLTFVLNILPLIVDRNTNSNTRGTMNANIVNKVFTTAILTVCFIPIFFIMIRRLFTHFGGTWHMGRDGIRHRNSTLLFPTGRSPLGGRLAIEGAELDARR